MLNMKNLVTLIYGASACREFCVVAQGEGLTREDAGVKKKERASKLRQQRTVMVLPDVERWIEREAAHARVSFSEALNRLLLSYWRDHREGEGMQGFEVQMTNKIAYLTSEIAQMKILLLSVQDRVSEIATWCKRK